VLPYKKDLFSLETLMVSVEDIREGFYKRLYGLQGQKSTYYTGYTFCTDYSTALIIRGVFWI
jgi:hypothetical protein